MKDINLIITVIPTFFTIDNLVNIDEMILHIENQFNLGIRSIIILGTTSEASVLSKEEKINIAKKIWTNYSNKITIFIGIGGTCTEYILDEANKMCEYCNGFMLSAPYYNKPTQRGLYKHFDYILKNLKYSKLNDNKIILYNIPSRCSINMEPETVSKIYQDNKDKIIGIKEASGNISQVMKLKSMCDINIIAGDDELILPILSIGGKGIISVISNIYPEEIIKIVNFFKNNDIENSNKIFYKLLPYIKACFIETNPVPIKYLLNKKSGFSKLVRLPLVGLEDKNSIYIDNLLKENL